MPILWAKSEKEQTMSEFVLTGSDVFGKYCRIAYGHALNGKQDYHIYKCIQSFRSNCYCDVPLTYQTENNCYRHDEIIDVVNVIHCGIDESKVIRVSAKDVEFCGSAFKTKQIKYFDEDEKVWKVGSVIVNE